MHFAIFKIFGISLQDSNGPDFQDVIEDVLVVFR